MSTNIVAFVTADPSGDTDSVLVADYNGQHWTFVFDVDPGTSRAFAPNGRSYEAYDPFGGTPPGIPDELWVSVEAWLEATFA